MNASAGYEKMKWDVRKFLVELMGFEPTTFPVSPGRAYQPLDHRPVFPGLDLPLAANGLGAGRKIFCVHQLPGTPMLQRLGVICLVVGDSCWQVFGLPDVIPARGITLQYVYLESHIRKFWWS
jgi:hypothetical protein